MTAGCESVRAGWVEKNLGRQPEPGARFQLLQGVLRSQALLPQPGPQREVEDDSQTLRREMGRHLLQPTLYGSEEDCGVAALSRSASGSTPAPDPWKSPSRRILLCYAGKEILTRPAGCGFGGLTRFPP